MDEQFSLCLTASLLSLLWFCVCDGNPNQIVNQFCHSSKYFYTPTINGAMKMFGNSGNYYCVSWAAAAHFLSVLCVCTQKNLNTYICLCVCLLHAKNRSKYRVFFTVFYFVYILWGCKPKWWQQRRRFFRNITTATAQPINRAQIENE